MSSCTKDLFSYQLVKKCSKSKMVCLKNSYHKDKSTKSGLHPQCKT